MSEKFVTKEKVWTFLAGAGSSIVMILAFFIPSLQDQYDRYQARKIIDQYEQLGNSFYEEEHYDMAEQAYEKAFELSDNKRLDVEIKRLKAKINRINLNPVWGAAPPDDLQEIDFQYVLHLLQTKEQTKERVATLNSYGLFLVASKKLKEAKAVFLEANQLDPNDVLAYVNLGNLSDQQGHKKDAFHYYQTAIHLDRDNARAHYNLALLYAEEGKTDKAMSEFKTVLKLDSNDLDAKRQLQILLEKPE